MQQPDVRILFDFSDPADVLRWQPVDDVVMGGRSGSGMQFVEPGVARFSGVVSLENNGGFASVRSRPQRVDLSDCTAILMQVRGDGKHYKFRLRDTPGFDGVLYEQPFVASATWQVIAFALDRFRATRRGRAVPEAAPLNLAQIHSFGILIGDKQEGCFWLELGWIRAT